MLDLSIFQFPILDARIDWISAYARRSTKADELRELAKASLGAEEKAGDKRKPWTFHAFRGEICGSWRYGEGESGTIIQVSGKEASLFPKAIAELSDHWARVDYCVTILDENAVLKPTLSLWQEFGRENEQQARPTRASLLQINDGSSTLYRGSRSSARFGRVYDKYRESNGAYPEGSWRWEFEAKRHIAKEERERWLTKHWGPEYAMGAVQLAWKRWGIGVPWRADQLPAWRPETKHQREADRLLEWLRTSVRPSVGWVLGRRTRAEVMDALGLTDIFDGPAELN